MSDDNPLAERVNQIRELMRQKLGVRGRSFSAALAKANRRLPRSLRKDGRLLADALPMAEHPKLRQTLDMRRLEGAAASLQAHLEAVDMADRRKGWILGVLGTIAFNLLVLSAIALGLLIWRGYL